MRSLRRTEFDIPEAPRERIARAARRHLGLVVAGFVVCALVLNAPALLAGARDAPFGFPRDANVAVFTPVARVVTFFGLDRPRAGLDDAFHPGQTTRTVEALPAVLPATDATSPPATLTPAVGQPTDATAVAATVATLPTEASSATAAPVSVPAVDPAVSSVPTTAPAPPMRVPTAADPLRVLIVGDSFMESLGASLERAFIDTGVAAPTRYYKPATGLARPDVYSWPAALTQSVADFQPEVVIVMLGGNDGQNLVQSGTGAPLEFGSETWLIEYHLRVDAAMDAVAGTRLYWLGMPAMRDASFGTRVQVLNSVYEAEAAGHPGTAFVPTWALFADGAGAYQAYLPDASGETQRMRADDGIHFTRAGADRLSDVVLTQVLTDFGIPPPA